MLHMVANVGRKSPKCEYCTQYFVIVCCDAGNCANMYGNQPKCCWFSLCEALVVPGILGN